MWVVAGTVMPSDAKKREQQRKKDAAKARQGAKKTDNKVEKRDEQNGIRENGTGTNGVKAELTPEGKRFFFLKNFYISIAIRHALLNRKHRSL